MFRTAPFGGWIWIVNWSPVARTVELDVMPPSVVWKATEPAVPMAVPFSRLSSHTVISAFSLFSSRLSPSLLPSQETDHGRSFRNWFLSL